MGRRDCRSDSLLQNRFVRMTGIPCLAFDRDIFQLQLHGGIRLYFSELSRALHQEHRARLRLLHPTLPSDVFPLSPESLGNVLIGGISLGSLLFSFASSVLPLPSWQTRKIYHATYYRNPFIRWSANPVVVTVHDLIHENCPQYFDPAYASSIRRYVNAKRRCIFAADAIIAVSRSTRDDLLHTYPHVEPARLHVIHHGSDHVPAMRSPEFREPYPDGMPSRPYILYVGSRGHYKGFNDLLHAFSGLAGPSQEMCLVCVGSPFTAEESSRIQRYSLVGHVISVQANEALLVRLYQHALGFVYPSWREGFGLPILEAMRSSCPVLCSDIPSSREIADRYALFFKAGDPQALLSTLRQLFELDPESRSKLLTAAQAHASRFTWKDAARRTCDLYLEILARHAS